MRKISGKRLIQLFSDKRIDGCEFKFRSSRGKRSAWLKMRAKVATRRLRKLKIDSE